MPKAEFISEDEFERIYEISNGRLITLKIDDDYSQVTFWNEDDEQLGSDMDFVFLESDFDDNRYLLARMYVPIKNQGLGRAALGFFKEVTDATIYARANDGNRRDDGSHLTEDAPGFVTKMQLEGLLE
jgi:hypothetical protein